MKERICRGWRRGKIGGGMTTVEGLRRENEGEAKI